MKHDAREYGWPMPENPEVTHNWEHNGLEYPGLHSGRSISGTS